MSDIDTQIAYLEGATSLPRSNGELVFEAPWQAHIFSIAVALHERGTYELETFRVRLAKMIASEDRPYYESWLAALEQLVLELELAATDELTRRTGEYATMVRDPVF